LNWLWAILGGAAVLEFAWLAASFMRPQKDDTIQPETEKLVKAGPANRFPRGSVTAFPRGRFYLVCMPDGGFLAVSRQCTHLGCTVPWDAEENKFVCPCHASVFDITGAVITAPAPRALDIYPVVIENQIIKVDISRQIKRNTFTEKQLTYADVSKDA